MHSSNKRMDTKIKRFNRDNPCPICGGWDSQKRGEGKRCHGFLSQDGKYAHCSREEWAGSIKLTEKSDTFAHILQGRCKCGKHHEEADGEAAVKIVKTYSYHDADGKERYQVVRSRPKAFRQRRRVKDDWVWNLDGVPRTLYRLPELLAAKPKRTVFVVEGEKDANNLAKLGLVTTTNPGGAGKWKDEYSDHLKGRKVVILPDNDSVGRDHAKQVAQSLIGRAKSVKILQLPNLPPHGDVSNWIKAGGTREKLKELASKAERFVAEDVAQARLPFRTAKEISTLKSKPVEWIVPAFVAGGSITILIGKVKAAGKTTFLTHMASAIVRGEDFMGFETIRTPVVYLTEQPLVSFCEALRRANLPDRQDFFVLQWTDAVTRPWREIANDTVLECKRRGAKLLIIDTIAPFAGLSGATENDAGHALDAMKQLQAATAAEIAVVVVQHERKGGGEVGEAGRGSTAFAGAADIVLSLSRPEGNGQETVRKVQALSRFDEKPFPMLIELTDHGYVSHGKVRPIATERASALILNVAPDLEKDAMTLNELVDATGKSRGTVQRAMNVLLSQHKITKRGKGAKNSPARFWRHNPGSDGTGK